MLLPVTGQYLLYLIPLLCITAVAHWLKVFNIIFSAQTPWKDMINGHQFEILCINIYMKTTGIVCGFNQVGAFFIAGRIRAIQAVGAEYT